MKLLIATDGSEFSEAAIKAACKLITHPNETEVKILSVFEPPAPVAMEAFMAVPVYQEDLIESLKQLAESYVDRARTTFEKDHPGLSITTRVIMGNPAQIIIETAKEWEAEIIVVGSHGRGFWSRALLGSVSDAVVHHAHCSVLVVRKARADADAEISEEEVAQQK